MLIFLVVFFGCCLILLISAFWQLLIMEEYNLPDLKRQEVESIVFIQSQKKQYTHLSSVIDFVQEYGNPTGNESALGNLDSLEDAKESVLKERALICDLAARSDMSRSDTSRSLSARADRSIIQAAKEDTDEEAQNDQVFHLYDKVARYECRNVYCVKKGDRLYCCFANVKAASSNDNSNDDYNDDYNNDPSTHTISGIMYEKCASCGKYVFKTNPDIKECNACLGFDSSDSIQFTASKSNQSKTTQAKLHQICMHQCSQPFVIFFCTSGQQSTDESFADFLNEFEQQSNNPMQYNTDRHSTYAQPQDHYRHLAHHTNPHNTNNSNTNNLNTIPRWIVSNKLWAAEVAPYYKKLKIGFEKNEALLYEMYEKFYSQL